MVTLSSILPPVNVTTVSGTLAVTNGGTGVTTSTGTGSVVLSNSPTLVTPVLGAASATSVTAALGSVTAPSFTFTGDTNTGIWSPAADTIAFSEGGVEAMRIDSSANVGIGTASPTNKLQVNGDVAVSYGNTGGNKFWTVFSNDYRNGMLLDGNNRNTQIFATTAAGDAGGIITFSTRQGTASGATDYGTERMRITSAGLVGIGTSSPSYLLHLNQNGNTQAWISATNSGSNSAGIGFENQGQRNWQIWADRTTDTLSFGQNSRASNYMSISGNGLVGIGTTSPFDKLHVDGNTLLTWGADNKFWMAFSNDYRMGMRLSSDTRSATIFATGPAGDGGSIRFNTRAATASGATDYGLERMRIISSGYVGIGTTAPNGELQVKTAGGQWRIETNGAGTKMVGVNAADTGEAIITMQGSPITFFSNGSERMRIDSSGNVGIGTSSPASKLDVSGGSSTGGITVGGSVASVRASSTVIDLGDSNRFMALGPNTTTAGTMKFIVASSNASVYTTAATIDASGNVGIGTSSPTYKLQVTGSASALRVDGTNTGTDILASFAGRGVFGIDAPGVGNGRFIVTDSGNVGIGTTTPAGKLSVVSASSQFSTIANWANYTVVGPNAGSSTGAALGFGYNTTSDLAEIAAIAPGVAWKPLVLLSAGMRFNTSSGGEAMRLDTSGNLLVGVSSGSSHIFSKNAGNGAGTTNIFEIQNAGSDVVAMFLSGTSYGTSNSAGTALRIGRSNTTSRSINAGGTINASGADYAEYMVKAGDFSIEKGEVCGINSDGLLTKDFSEAISFAVKSTDPAYVGGDVWGAGCGDDPDALELARQTVDRIAFAGQVPVNVYNAVPGQYIIPVDAGGSIGAEAVSNPTFEQYQLAVGKVIAIEQDGRAKIIVKIA